MTPCAVSKQPFLVGWGRGALCGDTKKLWRRRLNSIWTLVLLTGWCIILTGWSYQQGCEITKQLDLLAAGKKQPE